MRTKKEIEEFIAEIMECDRTYSMTYLEGLRAALEWVQVKNINKEELL